MHEASVIENLLQQMEALVQKHRARKVVALTLRLGPLAHISAEHLRHHFMRAAPGTVAEGARLNIEEVFDVTHPQAQDIILHTVELEE